MKRLFMFTLLAVAIATSAFATDNKKANNAALRNFNMEFSKASNVNWSSTDQYVKATFVLDDQKMEVFYNESGEKIGTSTAITVDELPIKTKRILAKDYSGYAVKEAIEFDGVDNSGYYISVENEKETIVLKVNSTNELSRYKVTKK